MTLILLNLSSEYLHTSYSFPRLYFPEEQSVYHLVIVIDPSTVTGIIGFAKLSL